MTEAVAFDNHKQETLLNPADVIQKVRDNLSRARRVWKEPRRGGYIVLIIDGKELYSGLLGSRMSGLPVKQDLAYRQLEFIGDRHFVSPGLYGVIRSRDESIPLTVSLCCSLHDDGRMLDFIVVLKSMVDLDLMRPDYALEMCEELECKKEYLKLIRMRDETDE